MFLINKNGIPVNKIINGTLYQGLMLRTSDEVIVERMKVAEYFSDDPENVNIILQTLTQSFLMFDLDTSNMPISLQLQMKINIFNRVTADQVLDEYNKNIDIIKVGMIMDCLNDLDEGD